MKSTSIFALLAASATTNAFVIPETSVFSALEVQDRNAAPRHQDVVEELKDVFDHTAHELGSAFSRVSEKVSSTYEQYAAEARTSFDDAFAAIEKTASDVEDRLSETYFDTQSWLDSATEIWDEEDDEDYSEFGHPPHHGPPHHGPPHHRPGHGPHHGKPNLTVWEMISKSNYTSKLAALIEEYDDIVDYLNSTSNITIFAPTNRAFAKIPEHHKKPSKEFIKSLLSYHVSPEFYPAGRVLVTKTIPTLLQSPALGKKPQPQRLSTNIGLRGLTVNHYARIVAVDIFGTNGVIHGVDSLIIPPPSILKIIDLLPSEFSTLELGLGKTGLLEKLNTTDHHGGTFFAPSNFAFKKLGPRINAFLFSSYGLKYLEALLQYHVVPEITLYSDALYKGNEKSSDLSETGIPRGHFHIDLPTMLEDRTLSIDIGRFGRLIEIKINSFARVAVSDGVAYDGVLHLVSDVIIPPKKLTSGSFEQWNGEELTEEDLMERLEPFVEKGAYNDDL